MKSYPYYIPQKNVILPWIPVRIGFKKTHKVVPAQVLALLDTGADVCFVSDEIAKYLGYSEKGKKTKDFRAADDKNFPTYPEKFTLYVAGKNYECQFYVSKTLPKGARIILGTHGFFDNYQVCFDVQNNVIQIVSNEDN